MVDFVTNKLKFIVRPRKKLFCGIELTILFHLEKNYVRISKQKICHGYKSLSIAYRL